MATKRAANRAERPGSAQRRRTTLLPHEAAHVLQLPVRNVRNLIRRGDLSDAGVDRFRRVAPDEVAQRLGGQPLAHQVLAAILDGRFTSVESTPTQPRHRCLRVGSRCGEPPEAQSSGGLRRAMSAETCPLS